MSLAAAYDPNNIFARIIRAEIPCVKIDEDDATLAFMDLYPQSRGHALVIPKRTAATNLFEIDDDALATLALRVKAIAGAMRRALKPDGVRIAQFNGAPAGQTVFHIHFHIIPVYAASPERPHSAGKPADKDELEALAAAIRSAL